MMKDPVQVLEQCKNIYLKKSEKETGYSNDDIVETYDIGIKMLNSLKSMRNDRSRTVRYLKVKAHRNSYKCDVLLLETWLIQSIAEDDTYFYAYNYLSQKANRQEGVEMFSIKLMSDFKLYDLLEKEVSLLAIEIGNDGVEKSTLDMNALSHRDKTIKGNEYALAFILDCYAKDEKPLIHYGKKKHLEQTGNGIMGSGHGNTFYKCFNLVINKVDDACKNFTGDRFFNTISSLVNNEDWRNSVLEISSNRLLLEQYLIAKSKQK